MVKRIQQIVTIQVAFKIVLAPSRFERVMQYIRAGILVKCDQAGALVFDDDIDGGSQPGGNCLAFGRADNVSDCPVPLRRFKFALHNLAYGAW